MRCPCCSGELADSCCLPYISGDQLVLTAEALMRSRYTAYTQCNIDYIAQTQGPPASLKFDALSSKNWAERSRWLALSVVDHQQPEETIGYVEFAAYFSEHGTCRMLHERSQFKKNSEHRWLYVDAVAPLFNMSIPKRNERCMCGSGKKFKQCCFLRC